MRGYADGDASASSALAARLRWRMRGAWLWPAFLAAHARSTASLLAALPPYERRARAA